MKKWIWFGVGLLMWGCQSSGDRASGQEAAGAANASLLSLDTDTVWVEEDFAPLPVNQLMGLQLADDLFSECPDPGYNSMIPQTFALLDEQLETEAFRQVRAVYALNAGWKRSAENACFRLFQLEFPDEATASEAAKVSTEIWDRGVGFKLSMEWDWIQKENRVYWIDAFYFTRKSETMREVKAKLNEKLD